METIKSWLRVCLKCSSGWGRIDLFCDRCWGCLWGEERYSRGYFVTKDFPVSVLWKWSSSSIGVETLIRAQKTTGLRHARQRIFQRYLSYPLGAPPNTIVYVIPKNKSRDHASEGALALSDALGVKVVALEMAPREQYKSKGRQERSQIQKMKTQYKPSADEKIWFYDDVITTGATAKAVWLALGKPQRFQVVALVYRERA